MTPAQLAALRDYIAADATLLAMALAGQDNDLADAINARTATIIEQPFMIGERGIIAALGIIEGPVFLDALDTFAAATLPGDHPLLAYQPGIKRAVKWLYGEGLDVGDSLTRQMLDVLASASVVTADSSAAIKATAEKTVSYPASVGWAIHAGIIASAVRDGLGNSLLG